MRFVAGRGAVTELLLAGAPWRSAIGKMLMAGALQRSAIGKLLLAGAQWRRAVGNLLLAGVPCGETMRQHREETAGQAAVEEHGRPYHREESLRPKAR